MICQYNKNKVKSNESILRKNYNHQHVYTRKQNILYYMILCGNSFNIKHNTKTQKKFIIVYNTNFLN